MNGILKYTWPGQLTQGMIPQSRYCFIPPESLLGWLSGTLGLGNNHRTSGGAGARAPSRCGLTFWSWTLKMGYCILYVQKWQKFIRKTHWKWVGKLYILMWQVLFWAGERWLQWKWQKLKWCIWQKWWNKCKKTCL